MRMPATTVTLIRPSDPTSRVRYIILFAVQGCAELSDVPRMPGPRNFPYLEPGGSCGSRVTGGACYQHGV